MRDVDSVVKAASLSCRSARYWIRKFNIRTILRSSRVETEATISVKQLDSSVVRSLLWRVFSWQQKQLLTLFQSFKIISSNFGLACAYTVLTFLWGLDKKIRCDSDLTSCCLFVSSYSLPLVDSTTRRVWHRSLARVRPVPSPLIKCQNYHSYCEFPEIQWD